MRFPPRTILGQLIAGSVIIQALVFGTFLSVSVRREFRETQQRDRQRLATQAHTLAEVLREPLSTSDSDMLDHIVRALPISATIKGARITDAAGNTLRISNTRLAPTLSARELALLPEILKQPRYRRERDENGADEGVQPVAVDGVVRGIVWITPDAGVTLHYPNAALQNVLTYGAFALVGNLLLVWMLSATMARPLRQLRRATLQVQNDPNDLSAFPLPVAAHNEAGALVASFNAMVSEIARQRRGTHETLSLLDAMLHSAPIGFAFYDRQSRYVRLNENMARLHGVPLAAHIGKRLRDLLPKGTAKDLADQTESLLAQVFQSGEPVLEQEISGILPGDPGGRTWQTSYFPVWADSEVRWVGVIATDITERKRTEEAMRRSERLAAAGRLAASIAHEINNPLESVTNLLYLLRNSPSLDAEAQEYTRMAQQELSRVGEITQQTLRFYRQSTLPQDVRLPDVLRSVLVLHQARLQSPRIDVQLRLSDRAILFGYAGELRQVFANLVGNAIDAMPIGGRLYIRAREARRHGKRGIRVTVADTGTGMAEAVRLRIFEPFFTTKDVTGTGLGLWVSAELLTKHRGSMLVRSRVSRFRGDHSGTVFTVFFPSDGVPRGPVIVTSAAQVLADHLV